MELETIKKSQRETTLELENLGKRSGVIDASITNRIQENTGKQLETLKEESQKSFKELQENTIKQVKKMTKIIQDVKTEQETIKKSQRETILELENLGKRS